MKFRESDGSERSMTFRVAQVTKPLASVSKICSKGNKVIFDGHASYILNKRTGRRTPLKQENGVFIMEIPIDFVTNKNDHATHEKNDTVIFPRQGM